MSSVQFLPRRVLLARTQPLLQRTSLLLDWKAMPTYAGFYFAREVDMFAKRGLQVSTVIFSHLFPSFDRRYVWQAMATVVRQLDLPPRSACCNDR